MKGTGGGAASEGPASTTGTGGGAASTARAAGSIGSYLYDNTQKLGGRKVDVVTNTQTILETALRLTTGPRAAQHGPKLPNHQNVANLWTAWLNHPVTPHDVAVMMVLLKISRTKTGNINADDYVDAAGYAAIAGELATTAKE